MFDNDVLKCVDAHLNHNYEYDVKILCQSCLCDVYPSKAKYFNDDCPSDSAKRDDKI